MGRNKIQLAFSGDFNVHIQQEGTARAGNPVRHSVLGIIITFLEGYLDDGLPEFEVRKAAVEVPPVGELPKNVPFKPVVVNINKATIQQLQTLPKIGPRTAERIVEYLEKNGTFRTLEELTGVRGNGKKTFANLRLLITVTPP